MKLNFAYRLLLCLFTSFLFNSARAQLPSVSESTAATFIRSFASTSKSSSQTIATFKDVYLLQGMDQIWQKTADGIYFRFIQGLVDSVLVNPLDLNKDSSAPLPAKSLAFGRSMLMLYQVTGQAKYFAAATSIWQRMQEQSMAFVNNFDSRIAFAAEYAALTKKPAEFDHITQQLVRMEANIDKDQSAPIYEQSLAQYGIALVDVLDYVPIGENRSILLKLLTICTGKIHRIISLKANTWQGIQPHSKSLYFYTLAKACRLGYVPPEAKAFIASGYAIIQESNPLSKKVSLSESPNEAGLGAWLLAMNEYELLNLPKPGSGRTVMLDSYFNNETKVDQSGNLVRWHYKWDERGNNGFSMWGAQFRRAGFTTATLYDRPSRSNLEQASVYIIVDPDSRKENKSPNYVAAADVNVLSHWVKAGGQLVLMANDSANTELDNFNKLAAVFGVQFNKDSKGKVTGNQFDMGRITIGSSNPLFKTARQIFIKEFSSLHLTGSAESILKNRDRNEVVAAVEFGKGKVLFIGDPWLYNEYVDGRKLPKEYDNFKAGEDIVQWIAAQ